MNNAMLSDIVTLLRQHYGTLADFGPLYRWKTLVNVIVVPRRSARRKGFAVEWIESGPLRTALETSEMEPAGLAEFLKRAGQSERLAGTLRALAGWWLDDDSRAGESAEGWNRPVETLRNELRSLTGVSLTLADRILLYVGGRPVFPIDRPTIRIAGRHGWMDSSAEYDEWQAFFARGANDSGDALIELHQWFSEAGREFCGPKPRCELCPLRSRLPPSGPTSLGEEGSD
jgi:endonuclease III-like uncharacterized protein